MKRTLHRNPADDRFTFKLMNENDAGRICHEIVREQIKAWVHNQGWSESKSRQVWVATWEALQNAIKYGSSPGEQIGIGLCPEGEQGMRVEISQTRPSWREVIRDVKKTLSSKPEELPLGGAVIMYKLASGISVSPDGRTVKLHFRE